MGDVKSLVDFKTEKDLGLLSDVVARIGPRLEELIQENVEPAMLISALTICIGALTFRAGGGMPHLARMMSKTSMHHFANLIKIGYQGAKLTHEEMEKRK